MAAAQVMQPQPQPPPLSTAQQQPSPLLPAGAGAAADSTSSLHSSTPKPKPKPRDEAASASSSSSSSSSATAPVNATANNSGYRSFFNFFHSSPSSSLPPPPPLSSSPPSILHPHPPPVLSQEAESIQVDAHAVAVAVAAHTQSAIRAAAPTMSAVSEDEVSPTRPQRGAGGGATSSPGEGSGSPKAFSDYDENRSVSGVGGNTTHGSGFLHPDERRKKRRKPSPPELLVIVRPPPSSKDRNPLNLQIQLVLPQAPPAGQARTSGESSRDATTTMKQPELRRRGSTSSSRSGRSEVTTASSSSYGGGSSSASSNRRVTPLYNLSIHSILPTTISDAGTDQRVAKYSKKGVEIDGFGVLEPSELLIGINDLATLEASGVNGGSGYGAAVSPGVVSPARASNDGIGEPTSDPGVEPVVEEPPTSFDSMTPEAQSPDSHLGAKLMRRFKGLSLNLGKGVDAPATTTGGGAAASIAPSTSSNSLKPSISTFLSTLGGPKTASIVKPATLASPEGATAAASAPLSARPLSTSGLSVVTAGGASSHDVAQMTPGGGLSESGRRTQGYYWTVKRYTRRVTDSEGHSPRFPLGADGQNPVLKNVWRRFNSVNRLGGDERHPHPSEIPLRFEWTREGRSNSNSLSAGALDSARAAKRLSTGSASAAAAGASDRVGRRASLRPPTARKTSSSQGHGRAVSTGRAGAGGRSQSSSARGSLEHNGRDSSALDDGAVADDNGDDDGDLSDPEDSETPWSCHLVLGASTRIPIGTLSPAPHHPKLVAQLAVPFPLPDLSQTGLGADGAGLTREEIKDVICVTCLHLVIRESFGGLGRVRRRGDRV